MDAVAARDLNVPTEAVLGAQVSKKSETVGYENRAPFPSLLCSTGKRTDKGESPVLRSWLLAGGSKLGTAAGLGNEADV